MTASTPIIHTGENARDLRLIACASSSSKMNGIRYSTSLLDRLRARVTEQFLSIPRGGLEVGGLLYGVIEGEEILISAYSEISIEYLNGPSFRLSPRDELELHKILSTEHPHQIVGWWHSHTRTDTSLTDEDLAVHARFFKSEAPLALIIKPHKFDPAQIAVYASDSGGVLSTVPCCQFLCGDEPEPEVLPAVIEAAPSPQSIPAKPPPTASVRYVAVAPPSRGSHGRRRLFATAAVAALLIGTAVGTAILRTNPPADPVRLELANSGDALAIRWNVDAPLAAAASSAELTIVDEQGRAESLTLRANELRRGSVVYERASQKLQIRLRIRSGRNEIHDATASFFGRLGSAMAAEGRSVHTEPAPRSESKEHVERNKTASANDKVFAMRERPRVADVVRGPDTTPPRSEVTILRPAQLPPLARRTDPPAPEIAPPPSLQVSGIGTPVVPTHAGATTTAPPPPPPPKPASGRAIWTGTLASGSTLLIDGRRPTMGALTGSMPSRPARVRVRAADLLESGLVIYTPSGEERFERPSAANGWNLTTYRSDARRAGSVAVVEAPAEANGWRRLMVRSNGRTLSALVIDWDELPAQ